ncbi:MAG: hypothetical protein GWP07_01355 [Xanthomonadaceae bacterium]|nr:hypothetical protein [Xanthomonadaceae bacterium]
MKNQTFMIGGNFTPTAKLNLYANLTYSISEQGFDNIVIPSAVHQLQMMGGAAGPDWAAQNYAWGAVNPDFSRIDDWVDLESNQLELNIGGSYTLTDNLSIVVSALYGDFNDKEYYIQDNDGSYFAINTGIEYRF